MAAGLLHQIFRRLDLTFESDIVLVAPRHSLGQGNLHLFRGLSGQQGFHGGFGRGRSRRSGGKPGPQFPGAQFSPAIWARALITQAATFEPPLRPTFEI